MSDSKLVQKDFGFRAKDGIKRQTVSVELYVPSAAGLIALLQSEDAKVVSLIEDLASEALFSHVRGYVDADENFDQETLNALVEKGEVSLGYLANLPKSERNTISKEMLEEFAKDYIAIMPDVTQKDEKKVVTAAGLFMERFKRVAGDNGVLTVLQEQLGIFMENCGEEVLAKHERVVAYLAAKLEELLNIKVTADAL